MIDLHTWPTPNGFKVSIMLEETGLPYTVIPVDISEGDQFKPEFLKISPNNKMPAIVDHDGPDGGPYALFESGAILMYLAEKTGRFMPSAVAGRYRVIQWLMFQMGDLGPMFGQAGHFMSRKDQPGMAPALAHFTKGAKRLMRVVDGRLGDNAYLGGDEYTIADMAVFPWCQNWEKRGFRGEDYPNFKRWFDVIQDRPAVVKSDGIAADLGKSARAARQGAGK